MSFTCYCRLDSAGLSDFNAPAQIYATASYFIIDTTVNAAVPPATGSGSYTGNVTAQHSAPVPSQSSVLPFIQSAIQAAEPSYPSMTFIWLGL